MEKNKIERVYILHEFGSPSHYTGLDARLKKNHKELIYYEFTFLRQFLSGIKHFKLERILRSFTNFIFMLNLIFTRNKKIVVGIAPLDYKVIFLLKLLNRHKFYYHTSWPYWSNSNFPKNNIINKKIFNAWVEFFNRCIHVFSVTETSKESIVSNGWCKEDKISVVYHSVNSNIFNYNDEKKENTIVFIGRLEKDKGVLELIKLFSLLPNYEFIIIGTGSYESKIKELNKDNVKTLGYVSNKCVISNYLKCSSYLLLPSKKRYDGWEELFGMVIIEAMACGCIPITTSHVGPKEILKNYSDLICDESDFINHALYIIKNNYSINYKKDLISLSHKYTVSEICKNWNKIDER